MCITTETEERLIRLAEGLDGTGRRERRECPVDRREARRPRVVAESNEELLRGQRALAPLEGP